MDSIVLAKSVRQNKGIKYYSQMKQQKSHPLYIMPTRKRCLTTGFSAKTKRQKQTTQTTVIG